MLLDADQFRGQFDKIDDNDLKAGLVQGNVEVVDNPLNVEGKKVVVNTKRVAANQAIVS